MNKDFLKHSKKTVLLVMAVLSCVFLLSACGGEVPEVTEAPGWEQPGTDTPLPGVNGSVDTADTSDDASSDTTADTTVPVITEPVDTKTEETTESVPVVSVPEYDYSKPVPESAAKDISYFKDAVFIGDSRTDGFRLMAGVWDAEYITFAGMEVKKFYTYGFYGAEKLTAEQALKSLGTNYGKVYISLGLNELGWAFFSVYYNKLGEIVDTIRAFNPNADIYLITVMPVSEQRSKQVYYESLENVAAINELIAQVAREKKVYYVDVDSIFRDAKGYLPEGYASDGVHLNRDPIMTWRDYLLTHTMEKN